MSKSASKKFFARGWAMVVVAFAVAIATQGFGLYSFSMFKVPMAEMLGVDQTQVALGFSMYTLTAGFCSLIVGDIIEKFGLRVCLILSALFFSGGFLILGVLDSLIMLYVGYVVMGVGSALGGMIVVTGIPTNWFSKRRGLAIAIVWCATLPGTYITTNLIAACTADGSWQTAAMVIAAVAFVILVVSAFILKWRPQEIGLYPDGMTKDEALAAAENAGSAVVVGLTRAQAVKTPAFWLLLVGFAILGIGNFGPMQNFPSFMVSEGYELAQAASFMSFAAFAGVCGKLVAGVIIDTIGPKVSYTIFSVLAAVALIMMCVAGSNMTVLFVAGFFFGAALSASTVNFSAATTKYLGAKHFGQIWGLIFLGKTIVDSVGVSLISAIGGGSGWTTAFAVAIVAIAVSAVANILARKDKQLEAMDQEAMQNLATEAKKA